MIGTADGGGCCLSENGDVVRPEMIVLTRDLYEKPAGIGFAALDPDPWLRPVA
ncbi:hypothetical protein J3R03_000495 [Actinoplanes couchii]|nr:hypothetical protein [Actinoplanes couchii]